MSSAEISLKNKEESQTTVEVRVDEETLELAARRLSWRIYSTNQPGQQLSLEQAVLAYRSEYLVYALFSPHQPCLVP